MSESLRAAIYVRQSVNHQEGIDRGLAKCRALVDARDWTVYKEYVDNAVSASKSRAVGTAWADMLADIKAGRVDVVVGVDIDRLVRTVSDLGTLTELGVKVLTVNGEIDLTTADGEFRATMLAGIARFEVRRKGERQLRGNEHRLAEGLPSAGGRRRFGFESDHLTPVPSEVEWILHLYKEVAAGASIRSVARTMNEAGVPTVTKGEWNAPRLQKILKNPAYRGAVIHKGQAFPSNKVPRIVPEDLAELVDAVMADPTRRTSPGAGRSALMGGMGECGQCGSLLSTGGTKSNGVMVPLYVCKALKEGTAEGTGHVSIRRAILDEKVIREVFAWIIAHPDAEDPQQSPALTALIVEAAEVERQRALATEMQFEPGALLPVLKKKLAALGKRADELAEAINSERGSLARYGVVQAVRERWFGVGEVAGDATWLQSREGYLSWLEYWAGMDLDTQREVVAGMLKVKVRAKPRNNRVLVEWL